MKHWSNFIDNATHATRRLAKLANPLTFEVQQKELELKNARSNLERFEIEICNKIAGNYSDQSEFETAILNARHKADLWNNEPIASHKPTHK
jgi:hypothetical protein